MQIGGLFYPPSSSSVWTSYVYAPKECVAQKNCTLAASLSTATPGSFHLEVLSSYKGSDDGNHWVALALSQDEKG